MSEVLRVALVAEGPTDAIFVEAVVTNLLGDRPFRLTLVQPERSTAFGPTTGTGWGGVYRWCRQAIEQTGTTLRDNLLFRFHDVLVIHLDADVADMTYESAGIPEKTKDLPCAKPCPPASHTTDSLREVLLGWVNEISVPPLTVLCTPSKSLEAWVLAALFPRDSAVKSGRLECVSRPKNRLQGKPQGDRLVRSGRSDPTKYREHVSDFTETWPRVRRICTEAERFSQDFLSSIPASR